jgi:hypothetical protein
MDGEVGRAVTELDLIEVNGLVARHGRLRKNGASADTLFDIERALLIYGVRMDHEVGPPDPHAPEGGTTVALRAVA